MIATDRPRHLCPKPPSPKHLSPLHLGSLALSLILAWPAGVACAQVVGASELPEFVLLGTTRIGDRISAMLRHRSGSELVVVSEAGRVSPMAAYGAYAITRVESGRVWMQLPDDARCLEQRVYGVSCAEANTAVLELMVGVLDGEAGSGSGGGIALVEGPASDETQSSGSAATDQDLEVPPGMMLITSPSGAQRLVPED